MTPQAEASTSLGQRLQRVYGRLYPRYGPQGWWPGSGPWETIMGAILTQNTAWGNVERALTNLRQAGLTSPRRLRDAPLEELARLLRPSGYFNSKARKLRAFVQFLDDRFQDDLDAFLAQDMGVLRLQLLSLYGIGEETADDIVLYAAHKPSFVIDSYTRRILLRLGVAPDQERYVAYQALFHDNLPPDVGLFNEYHALLDRHAQETCRKRQPLCEECCLLDLCSTGRQAREERGKKTGTSPG